MKVGQISWNPTTADTIAVLLTDGQIKMIKLTGTIATVAASLQGTATAGELLRTALMYSKQTENI